MDLRPESLWGYTLIELSVVIMILGVLVGGGVQLYQKRSESVKLQETTQKILTIDTALQDFYRMNGYLPCPAPGNATSREPTKLNLPEEEEKDPAEPQEKEKGFYVGEAVAYDKKQHRCISPQGKTGQLGTAPTRTLRLADEMMLDAWGRKIGYRLAEGLGTKEDFSSDTYTGNIGVEDETGTELTAIEGEAKQGAAYVLISYGLNGVYAWQRNGEWRESSLMPLPEREEENGPDDDTVFRQAARGSDFDDIVLFRSKGEIVHPRRVVQPITIPDFICERAAAVVKEGLGDHFTSEPERAAVYLETARAMHRLCKEGAAPLEVVCGRNLAWVEDTDTKKFSCRCLKDEEKYRTSLALTKFGLCLED